MLGAKIVVGAAAVLGAATGAMACDPITFENLATGTVVTTQYRGVTFSANAQTCASPTTCRIVAPPGGTSSGSKGIALATGCPDFSPEGIRMVFADTQTNVQFNVGLAAAGTVNVRAFNDANGQMFNRNYALSAAGVTQVVRIATLGGIRRVEVANTVGDFEYIDDLVFDEDATPPGVTLAVADFSCVCASTPIPATVTEPESGSSLVLERLAVGVPGATWTTFASDSFARGGGTTSSTLPSAFTPTEGYYYIRATVENRCGLTASDQRIVYVPRMPLLVDVRSPHFGDVVGGNVCFDGTASDLCGATFTVEQSPSPTGAPPYPWQSIGITHAPAAQVTNDTLAVWDSRMNFTGVDGDFYLKFTMTRACGFVGTQVIRLTVDNTPPTAQITNPVACAYVRGVVPVMGSVSDAHLAGWALDYTGGDAAGWVRISQGTGAVTGGVLGMWNTTGLRPCAYTLRLTATDTASVNCGTASNASEKLVSVNVGCAADFDRNGTLNVGDVFVFLTAWFAGCP